MKLDEQRKLFFENVEQIDEFSDFTLKWLLRGWTYFKQNFTVNHGRYMIVLELPQNALNSFWDVLGALYFNIILLDDLLLL
jgi:hypothetical protein